VSPKESLTHLLGEALAGRQCDESMRVKGIGGSRPSQRPRHAEFFGLAFETAV